MLNRKLITRSKVRDVGRLLLVFAACLPSSAVAQTAISTGTANDAQWLSFDLPADRSSLVVSLSVRQKELGDMLFENGESDAARNAYNDALATLKAIKVTDGNNLRDLLDLIEHDAIYRKMLLDARLPFWGARISAEPQLPLLKAEALKNRVLQIRALADEISALLDKLRSSEISVVEKSLSLDQVDNSLDTNLVQLEQLNVKNAYFSER